MFRGLGLQSGVGGGGVNMSGLGENLVGHHCLQLDSLHVGHASVCMHCLLKETE